MDLPELVTLEAAAQELGVPRASLRTAAATHGFLIRLGGSLRLDRNKYQELIQRCHEPPKMQSRPDGVHQ